MTASDREYPFVVMESCDSI